MALNFPTNPNINDVYSSGNRSWIWDGTVWNVAQGLLPYGGITVPSDVSQLTDTTNLIPDSLLDLGISIIASRGTPRFHTCNVRSN